MKRLFAAACAVALCLCALAGCTASEGNAHTTSSTADRRLSIVTTMYPEYDWVMQILGDTAAEADVTLLIDNGTDLHSYQPSAQDIKAIADCDVLVYVGGESDDWAADALAQSGGENVRAVNLLDALGDAAREEEVVEGMQAEAEVDGEEAEGSEEASPEYDEHVWLSLKNAMVLCGAIADELSAADPENAQTYASNAAAYIDKLAELDAQYQEVVNAAPVATILVADRFPYRYLVDDYGISYFAAFAGCSAETEASFETIAYLAQKIDELGLTHVLVNAGSDERIANAVIAATQTQSQNVLVLDPMETAPADLDGDGGYLSVMEGNLDVLRLALS